DLKTGEMQHFEFSYDMSKTNMEEYKDLEVAVWIQDYDSFVIYNSNYLYEYTDYPYPVQNLQLDDNDSTLLITWETPEQGSPLGYNIYINDELVAENHNELSYSTNEANGFTVVKVVAVYENGKTSASVIDNILIDRPTEYISENNISLNVYPNPVNDKLYIVTVDEVKEVVIYDIYGRRQITETPSHQGNWTIDLSELKSGIYFVKINTEKGNIVKRIIKD
ncbi:MAG: T9SS type A sorting domain-containing protein, partial [Bacteroidales bacterium]|nr:T9SS type A sorting domain-containing protein [Bacteroidales bacterium]